MHAEWEFEDSIEAHLLAHGWHKGSAAADDRGLGLAPGELVAFLVASQPDEGTNCAHSSAARRGAREDLGPYGAAQLTRDSRLMARHGAGVHDACHERTGKDLATWRRLRI